MTGTLAILFVVAWLSVIIVPPVEPLGVRECRRLKLYRPLV